LSARNVLMVPVTDPFLSETRRRDLMPGQRALLTR
jgi:hypothetical protein